MQAISGSSSHPILVSFLLLGSRDLVEQDQISFVTFWHYCDILLKIQTEIRKSHPLRQRTGDVGKIVELCYNFGVLWFVVILALFHIYICAYGCDVSSIILPLSFNFLNG